jgi:hypothetical protein
LFGHKPGHKSELAMTKDEWRRHHNLNSLLEAVGDRASARKLRLFGCACCRLIWDHLNDDDRRVVETVERFADGNARLAELEPTEFSPIYNEAVRTARAISKKAPDWEDLEYLANRARYCSFENSWEYRGAVEGHEDEEYTDEGWSQEVKDRIGNAEGQTHVFMDEQGRQEWALKDVFHYRTVSVRPDWLTSTVTALATGIYEERAYDRMPILADALQDAGCADDEILDHCRDANQVHVRGCWVVDLVLGKE